MSMFSAATSLQIFFSAIESKNVNLLLLIKKTVLRLLRQYSLNILNVYYQLQVKVGPSGTPYAKF